jgi:hypothetical protein
LVRELCPQTRRSLQAEHLKPDLAVVEAKVPPRCPHRVKEIQSLTEHFKSVPEYRERVESYPVWSLLTLVLLAVLCEAPRGQPPQEDLIVLDGKEPKHGGGQAVLSAVTVPSQF